MTEIQPPSQPCPDCLTSPGGLCLGCAEWMRPWREIIDAVRAHKPVRSTDPMVNGQTIARYFINQAMPPDVQDAAMFFLDSPRSLVTTLPVGSNQGEGDVWQDIIDEMPNGLLRDVCIERRLMGIEKHGKPLGYCDGRGLKDGLQEALDLAAYMRRDGLHEVSRAAIALAAIILAKVNP